MSSRLPAGSLSDGSEPATVLLETMAPLLSVTVVVTDPSALVVTVVVSDDEGEEPLREAAPEPAALLVPDAPLVDRSEDATEALEPPMEMLTGELPWIGSTYYCRPSTTKWLTGSAFKTLERHRRHSTSAAAEA